MEGPRKSGSSRSLVRLLLIAAVVGGVIAAAARLSPSGLSDWDQARVLPLAIMLILIVMRLTVSARPLAPMAKQLALFLAFGAVLVVGYSYRDDFNRISDRALGALVPAHGVAVAPGVMRFHMDDSGQFAIDTLVNGVGIHFLVDTGASGIALSQRDASRLGLRPGDLSYNILFSTANGTVRAAPITLDSLQIGPLTAKNARAYVNQGDLDISLLGMSYLSTLGRIEIKGGELTLER